MSQQFQPEGSNQSHDPPVEEQGLLVPDQVQTVSHKRSAEGLSVGGDSIADLIRKAKASRTAGDAPRKVLEDRDGASAGSGAVDTPMDESLESALSCPICSDYLYRPVAAIPCLHVFCGSCLVPWINRSSVCPNCRARVTAVKDDHRTNNLLEMYLKLHPEKARAEEDKADLDKIYKPGNVVKITRVAEDYSDEEEARDEDEDDEDMEDWRQRQLEATRMPPCLCCDPTEPNVYGYTCEHPIPLAPAPLDGAEYREGIGHHRRCNACLSSMPLREGMACESCSYNWCGSLFPCPRQGLLKKFEDITPPPTLGGWATFFNAFGGNRVELEIYNRWVTNSELTSSDIVSRFKEYFLEEAAKVDYLPGVPVLHPTNETLLCETCFIHWMRMNFMDWWIYEKEKSGVVDNRDKCWYGRNCRTQGHNPGHAARLNHACHEVPVAERHVRNPGRLPVAPQVLPPAVGAPGPARGPTPPHQVAPDVPLPQLSIVAYAPADEVAYVPAQEAADIPGPPLSPAAVNDAPIPAPHTPEPGPNPEPALTPEAAP